MSAVLRRRVIFETGRVSPIRHVPSHIEVPSYVKHANVNCFGNMSPYTPLPENKIPCIRRTCKTARKLLDYCGSLVKPGITTEDLDAAAHEFAINAGCYPSPLLYHGFPKSICTSVNNVVCHGIPDDSILHDGDIINIDVTLFREGVHGDCAATFLVGKNHSQDTLNLLEIAKLARDNAIAICGPNVPFSNIYKTIYNTLKPRGFMSFYQLTGHGIGTEFHSEPSVINWPHSSVEEMAENKNMTAGMTFTVEPAVTPGDADFYVLPDNWTLLSLDNSWNAYFEHTILITNNGHEILT